MKLVLVDDNLQFREDLKFFLQNKLNHTVIAEASSGEESLALNNLDQADVVLMDLSMERMNGFEAAKKIIWNFPMSRIVGMTMYKENLVMWELIETGFRGFIFKTEIFRTLELVLQSVYADQNVE
jgi:DNA-binding NarL/FixJ family response regulator